MRNIALILFFKCDVTKFKIPPPFVTMSQFDDPLRPHLTCDLIYKCSLIGLLSREEKERQKFMISA